MFIINSNPSERVLNIILYGQSTIFNRRRISPRWKLSSHNDHTHAHPRVFLAFQLSHTAMYCTHILCDFFLPTPASIIISHRCAAAPFVEPPSFPRYAFNRHYSQHRAIAESSVEGQQVPKRYGGSGTIRAKER